MLRAPHVMDAYVMGAHVVGASCYGCACWVSVSGGSSTFRSTHPQQHEVHRLWNTVFSTSTAAADTTVMSEAHSVGVQVTMLCIMHKKIYHK